MCDGLTRFHKTRTVFFFFFVLYVFGFKLVVGGVIQLKSGDFVPRKSVSRIDPC